MRKELGQLIRKHRTARKLKREELAKKLGVSIHYVMHLENECRAAKFSYGLMGRVIRTLSIPKGPALKLAEAHNLRVRRYLKELGSRRKSA